MADTVGDYYEHKRREAVEIQKTIDKLLDGRIGHVPYCNCQLCEDIQWWRRKLELARYTGD